MKEKSVVVNAIFNMILTVSNFLFPLITFPYISRILQAEGIGKVTFSTSIVGYFTLVASLGIPTYGIRECAKVRENKDELSKLVHELMAINIVMTGISILCCGIITISVDRIAENQILIYINLIGMVLNVIGVNWVYSALEEYEYITKRSIIFKILSIIAIFIFIKDSQDYIIYASILVIANGGSNILNFINLKKHINFKRYDNYTYKKHLQGVIIFFAQSAAITIYTNLDSVMLGFIKGDFEVGLYSAACKIKYVLLALITSVGKVMLPRLSFYVTNQAENDFYNLILKNIYFVVTLSIPMIIFIVFTAEQCIMFLLGDNFEGAVIALKILTPTLILIGLSTIMGAQILAPRNQEFYALKAVVIGAIVNIITNIALIQRYGVIGVSIGTVLAELAVVIYEVYYLRRLLRDIIDQLEVKKYIYASVVCMLLMSIGYFYFDMSSILLLISSAIILMLTFICILCITKHNITLEIIKNMISYIKQSIHNIKGDHNGCKGRKK